MGTKSGIKIAVVFLMSILLTTNLSAQQTKTVIFLQANEAMQNAKSINADILAPSEYSKAIGFYQDAEKDFDNSKGIEKVESTLIEAVTYFNRSINSSNSAKYVFANTLNAREDALSAKANIYSKKHWLEAEELFIKATKELEKGDRDDAYKESVKAIDIYRNAELTAIKTDLLDETRKLLKEADDLKVEKKAPTSLNKAKSLLSETEKELETNRYDMDYPRILAKEAKYEARHSIYLFNKIKTIEKEKIKLEELILSAETPVIDIAEAIGFTAQFDEGYEKPKNIIIDYIADLQNKYAKLNRENVEQNYKIGQLEDNVVVLKKERDAINDEFKMEIDKRTEDMKTRMQEIETEKARLNEKIEYQSKINRQFLVVNNLFKSNEASVLRSGNDVIISMHGFEFEVGKSEIRPANFDLLAKVKSAIKTFPNSRIVVEGYTDSFGGDSLNLKLSQKRSDAVSEYLKANMPEISSSNISSVGHGENNPVANNETKEGRRMNRRIDVIIKSGISIFTN